MPTETALRFRDGLTAIRRELSSVDPAVADVPWRPGGWTRKQIVGHLLDSAANNRQRFVRATIERTYSDAGYDQDAWVAIHGYAGQSWDTLLRWWNSQHELLAALVDCIPEERLSARCLIEGTDVTLRFVIEDYVAHQQHHLRQIMASG